MCFIREQLKRRNWGIQKRGLQGASEIWRERNYKSNNLTDKCRQTAKMLYSGKLAIWGAEGGLVFSYQLKRSAQHDSF